MKNYKRKGQSAIEFIAYVSITLVILTGLTAAIFQQQERTILYTTSYQAQQLGQEISSQAELALVEGEGYSREFTVPNTLSGQNYTIYVVDSTTVIELESDGNVTIPNLYRGDTIKKQVETEENNLKIQHTNPGEIELVTR